MFHAEYSSGSPLRMLVDLRNVIDAALARTSKKASEPKPDLPEKRAKAAAAGVPAAPASFEVPEFEVNSPPAWDEDAASADPQSKDDDNA
jgi:hypothetical protein